MQKPVVLLLAGGVGKRFKPFVINKTLFPFFGKPLLQYCLDTLQKAGLSEVIIVTNKQNDTWLTSYNSGLKFKKIYQESASGMGQAMLLVEKELNGRAAVVISATKIIDENFLPKFLAQTETKVLLTARKTASYFSGSYLNTDKDKVSSIVEKPGKGKEPSNLVNTVIDYFEETQKFIDIIKKIENDHDDQYERALDVLIKSETVNWILYEGYYQKLKYGDNVLDMTALFLKNKLKPHISPAAKVSSKAEIQGDVCIEENAIIDAFAVIKGPAYIGKNTIVGAHTMVRSSIVENDAVIGYGSEIARSYVGPQCKIHHANVADSVLENDVKMAYGSCTANLRFDNASVGKSGKRKLGALMARGVFVGVNASLMPGVCIEENTKIYPNSVVK
jgi:NDP-sugar pyrophosphorylase family protein